MTRHTWMAGLILAATIAAPAAGRAQGVVRGANEGAAAGERAAGTVGGIVGSVVGGAVGAANGIVDGVLGVERRPRFREYVVREARPSYAYDEPLAVGTILPGSGITYYDVPAEYGADRYRYTVVNKRTVLVDPATRRVVEIVE